MGDLEYAEKTAATKATEEFGRVDTLVLNAGASGSCRTSLWNVLCLALGKAPCWDDANLLLMGWEGGGWGSF